MFQLRMYTLRSREALQRYAPVHWARHVPTFAGFGMASPEFADDMAGFDVDEIVDVQSVLIDPTTFSPIR